MWSRSRPSDVTSLGSFLEEAVCGDGINDVLQIARFDDHLGVRERSFVPWIEANGESSFFEHPNVTR
jgi:hypothetical protein